MGRLAATASLARLDACVSVCRACPRLVAWRERVAAEKRAAFAREAYWGRPVPAFGDPSASVLIVGLAPAAHGANRTGRMFTGDRSGDWLFAALHRAGFASQPTSTHADDGLRLSGVRITALCHCAPPANRPDKTEVAACGGWLDRELTLLAPRLRSILCLGGLAWDGTLAAARRLGWEVPSPRPRFGHGAEAELVASSAGGGAGRPRQPAGRPVRLVGSYHVSQQNTFTGRLTEAMLDDVLARLR
nr:uracil-DNA glycosylase [Propionibacterium sp.]